MLAFEKQNPYFFQFIEIKNILEFDLGPFSLFITEILNIIFIIFFFMHKNVIIFVNFC